MTTLETAFCHPTHCNHQELQQKIQRQAIEIEHLRHELKTSEYEIERQQHDFGTLHSKHLALIEQLAQIQHQRDQADRELEELSTQLFEEANRMVAHEKKRSRMLEQSLSQTWNTPDPLFEAYLGQFRPRPLSIVQHTSYYSVGQALYVRQGDELVTYDHPHQYLDVCQKGDVEPCLSLGNERICVKTLVDRLRERPCLIESITVSQARQMSLDVQSSVLSRSFWERRVVSWMACAGCKRSLEREHDLYRFRLEEDEDWLLIDRECRNRLVAVCNFYSFLRNISLGHYQNRSLKDLYVENIQLRMQMFYSR